MLGFVRMHGPLLAALLLLAGSTAAGTWSEDGSTLARSFTVLGVVCCIVLSIDHARKRNVDLTRICAALGSPSHASIAPHYLSANGELSVMAEAVRRTLIDASERSRQDQEMIDQMRTVLGAMVEGVLAVDNRQHVLFANPAAGHMLGIDPRAARGKPLLGIVRNHKLDEAVNDALSDRDAPNLETRRYEFDSHDPLGRVISFRATRLHGEPCPGVVLVLQDISELRRLEMLRQDFIANVSHELKTPLAAIKAYAETLHSDSVDDVNTRLKFLTNIGVEADRLNGLIVDMLRLAKIESGHAPMRVRCLDLAKAIRACVERFETRAMRSQKTLRHDLSDAEVLIQGDADGLRTILDNLTDNALKYTPNGGEVLITCQSTASGRINLLVTDTGPGIPVEHQPRVFERFFRVDQARSRELGSTGLGLAIVKHLAHAFGASVAVSSQVGVGTTFRVMFQEGKVAKTGSNE